MRLLTAGSLVRVQQGEPKRAGRHRSSCSFSLYLLTQTVDSATHSHTAVNWLGAPRCLRQMKRCYEQEETTSIAKRSKRARRLCFWPKGSLVRVQQGEPAQKPWTSTGSGLFLFLKQFEISVCLTLFNVSMWIFCTIFIYWHYHWLWYNQFVE